MVPTSRHPFVSSAILFSLLLFFGACSDIPAFEPPADGFVAEVEYDLAYDVRARSTGCVSGIQTSGALFEICKPADYDGTLVLYAHGFVLPQLPLAIPEREAGWVVKDFVLGQSHAYAATSYYTNGLVEPLAGVKDVRELIAIFTREFERPQRTYLIGVSNGAFLSIHLMEKSSGLIDGALTACGPVGSYVKQIDYLGDIGVLFDVFFGDVQILPAALGFGPGLPGDQTGYDDSLIPTLEALGASLGVSARDALGYFIGQAMAANPAKSGMLLQAVQSTSSISRGRALYTTIEEGVTLIVYAMVYNAFNTNDVREKLGGDFFHNLNRVYADAAAPSFSEFVNQQAKRYEARPYILARLYAQYETKGNLKVPTVALHTTRDPLVPAWHHDLYADKLGRRSGNYEVEEISGFGHCTFQEADLHDAWSQLIGTPVAII